MNNVCFVYKLLKTGLQVHDQHRKILD